MVCTELLLAVDLSLNGSRHLPTLIHRAHFQGMVKGVRVKKEVQAKVVGAKQVPKHFEAMDGKEPTTAKEKQRKHTLLGLRKIGAPAVRFSVCLNLLYRKIKNDQGLQ